MNPPVGSSIRLGGIGRLRAILLLIGMSSLAVRGESNPRAEDGLQRASGDAERPIELAVASNGLEDMMLDPV